MNKPLLLSALAAAALLPGGLPAADTPPATGAAKPVVRQKMPATAKQALPASAVELPCISTMSPGAPPYSTTGFTLEARNSFSAAIPAGTAINVNYTIRYHESIGLPPQAAQRTYTLTSPLAPGQTIGVVSIAQGPYVMLTDCKPWFNGGLPDLQVLDASLVSGQLRLLVRNGAPFVTARSSVARVRLAKCSQIELGSIDVAVPQVQPQTTITVLKSVTLPAGFQYFDAIADIARTVRESNENNNTFTGVGVCIH
ncbi:MAG: hypothetical protein ACM3O7_00025 [Acidobacteriota bacterium]